MTNRVFVYGTLMPGEPRWPLLKPFAVAWERATACGRLWDTGSGYPAARFDGGEDGIPGFLVTLDARRVSDALATLDPVEGEGVLYRRVRISTSGGEAFTYEWLGSTAELIQLIEGWPS